MQSWGVQSQFGVRDTGREPSKSGVIGLLCAALGRPRHKPVADLAALMLGVRVDKEGSLAMDYHTAQNVYRAAGGIKPTELSRRYYLADAAFLVGLESDNLVLLKELSVALSAPHWPLYLGRKAFVPSPPVYIPDGLKEDEDLLTALKQYPWLGHNEHHYEKLKAENGGRMRIVVDDANGESVRNDQPVSFEKWKRRFAPRRVHTTWIDWPKFADKEIV